jgi:uncharacterized membrane protein
MSSIESSKTMAMIGSILMILGGIPWAGGILSVVGVILLLIAIKGFSSQYQDSEMYDNALRGFIYYIIAAIAFAVSFGFLAAGFESIFFLAFGIAGFIAGLVVAFIFYLMAAKRLRATLNSLSQKTGEKSFETAGMLLWYGAILSIIFIGGILIFIAWIFATIGFFSMKTTGQTYSTQQPYPPPPPPSSTQETRYCPNCGAPVQPGTVFCPNCGKQLPS